MDTSTNPQYKRKWIRRVSTKRAVQLKEYYKARKLFLSEHPYCAVYPLQTSTEVHHIRGRIGKLLLDQRFWLPVSEEGHEWIHRNPTEARGRGWLAPLGKWNDAS